MIFTRPFEARFAVSLAATLAAVSCGHGHHTVANGAGTSRTALAAPSLAAPTSGEVAGALRRSIASVTVDIVEMEPSSEHAGVEVSLVNGNTFESAVVTVGPEGQVNDEDRETIEQLFRCRRTDRTHRIEPGLLAKLADLSVHFGGRDLEVVSAYRHPPHASRGSRHRKGRAVDLRIDGVKAREVRDYLWTRYRDEVGVGFYIEQQFVHIDHRPSHPPTAWTQRRANEAYRYDPGWARRIDRKLTRIASAEAVDSPAAR